MAGLHDDGWIYLAPCVPPINMPGLEAMAETLTKNTSETILGSSILGPGFVYQDILAALREVDMHARKKAIADWNRRAPIPTTDADVERLALELFRQHYELDDASPEWIKMYQAYGFASTLEHKGDCPHAKLKGPITCDRCVADEWRERARAAIAAMKAGEALET